MKKIVALALALVMVLGLCACSVQKTEETKPAETQAAAPVETQAATPEAAPVEISLWTYPIGKWTDEATVKSLLADFNAAYPNITVKV